MPTITETFADQNGTYMDFTSIVAVDTTTGSTTPFSPGSLFNVNPGPPTDGLEWNAFRPSVTGPGSTQVINISYNIVAHAGYAITSIDLSLISDILANTGTTTITAVERVYDSAHNLLATVNWDPSIGHAAYNLVQGYSNLSVEITINEAIAAGAPANTSVGFSDVQQNYTAVATNQLCKIGDVVFFDMTGSGVQASATSGPGVPGVTVQLLNATGTTVLATTTTDASGHYLFDNLVAGVYEVKFIPPAGYTISPQGVGGNIALDSTPNQTTGITAPITLTVGQSNMTIDAGIVPPGSGAGSTASIGDRVWLDANRNGIQDTGETGVAGVTVKLLNNVGGVITTTTTDTNGLYNFANLNAGVYQVQFITPAGKVITLADQGVNDATDSDASSSTGLTTLITLTTGQINNTIDAGLQVATAGLGNFVWCDTNGNGIQDSGEAGVAGVTVKLLNSAGGVVSTTTTDSVGQYSFTGLDAGVYQVQFVTPTGKVFTLADQGVNDAADSDANASTGLTSLITLAAGEFNSTIDAGLKVATAGLGNFVWCDTNGNGIQDSGEAGAAGVTVKLLNSTGGVVSTTTTDAVGQYSFTGLTAGVYQVQFVTPSGKVFTLADQGVNDAADSDANASTGLTSLITLAAGEFNSTIDAGLKAAPTAALGDKVWFDVNRDGVQNANETGVAGVTVKLLNAAGTTVLSTTTTDSLGNYAFTGLNAGSYAVSFAAPSTYKLTTQDVGTNDAADSDANATTGITGPITLTAGQINNTIDAGLQKVDSISIHKVPCDMVVRSGDCVTYTYNVTNTGTSALTNVKVVDNIGTAVNTNNVVAKGVLYCGLNVGDVDRDGKLDVGETWKFTTTVVETGCNTQSSGSVCQTLNDDKLCGGKTAWMHASFKPTNTCDGATYVFKGVTCTISGAGVGTPVRHDMPDARVTFSRNCYEAKTQYDSDTHCWVTTLPANCNPGNVFICGVPVTVPAGCNWTNANATFNCEQSANNCGLTSLSWRGSCDGYNSFQKNGCDGYNDYNQIGVKVCDRGDQYGCGGSVYDGYGWDGGNYCGGYTSSYGCNNYGSYGGCYGGYSNGCGGYGGYGYSNGCGSYDGSNYNNGCGDWKNGWDGYGYYGSSNCYTNGYGWSGSDRDCAGTPENQYTSGNCQSNNGNYNTCGTGTVTSGKLGDCTVVDTATVTATTATGGTVSDSDVKSVQVLSYNSIISTDSYCPPTGSLSALYGTARKIEFTYNPSDTVSLKQVQAGLAVVTGHNANSMAFIEITNNSNPFASGAKTYFKGSVMAGQEVYADATVDLTTHIANAAGNDRFSTVPGADMFAFIFRNEDDFRAGVGPLQTIEYNTSGSQAMHIGDQLGSLKVIGYVGTTGGFLMSN